MEKEFGKIKKGNEEEYMMQLSMLEGNVLKIHREDPNANSRRLREAIALVLFEYYRVWVMCLLRIKESIDTWEKRMGSNGYIFFLNNIWLKKGESGMKNFGSRRRYGMVSGISVI